MTPWFELVRHTRARHAELVGHARDRRLVEHAAFRRAPGAYAAVWWWCRPRDGTVYVLRDRRGRLGVTRG